jgi:adenylosuccinate lyase
MLLELTRTNQKITADSIIDFVENLNVSDEIKDELKAITPFNYTGF